MPYAINDEVVLTIDLPRLGLCAGHIGLVRTRSPSSSKHLNYEVEFVEVGGSIAVTATIFESQLRQPYLYELRAVRARTPYSSKDDSPKRETADTFSPMKSTAPMATRPAPDSTPASDNEPELFPGILQPWNENVLPPLEDDDAVKRAVLLDALARSDLGRTEERIARILQQFPDTRDSDIALAIRYWETYQADILERWDGGSLDILYELQAFEYITRLRRHIQNDLDLFVGTLRTRLRRGENQRQFYQYLAEKRHCDPEIRFFLDETRTDPSSRYTGVAGICAIDWRQYEKHHAALTQWRRQKDWPETLHFSDARDSDIDKHLALLAELQKRRGGLLFVGHDIPTRGSTFAALVDLFVQLIVISLERLRELQCLNKPSALVVIKEAEEHFDKFHLQNFEELLHQQLAYAFPHSVYLKQIEARPKGREVLLESADLLAGGMQRRALYGGWNHKDRLAEAVMNVSGFEDSNDKGAVYHAWY